MTILTEREVMSTTTRTLGIFSRFNIIESTDLPSTRSVKVYLTSSRLHSSWRWRYSFLSSGGGDFVTPGVEEQVEERSTLRQKT